MDDRKTILIVDDSVVYQKSLTKILEKTYIVLQAYDGQEATEILLEQGRDISLIFLDLMMPVMDGYEFLKWVLENGQYIDIPIVVTTSESDTKVEVQCLELGASEFVSKPFNPDIVIKRIESLIRLHETSVFINNVKFDSVTGALNKEMFIEKMTRAFRKNPDKEYDVVCFDIEGYRMLIDRYGEKRCGAMKKNVYETISSTLTDEYYLGKLSESQFVLVGPSKPMEVHEREMLNGLKCTKRNSISGVIVNCGVYQNVDKSLDAETILHNAIMAAESIHNRYGVYCARYDEALRERASKERFFLDNMKTALDEKQFHVFYQPKFLISNNTVSGAEALVRWIHPEKGFMNPGEFIPTFEHNGFIQELDKYMLEEVCSDLREWIDEGKKPVPISVNVSQANFDKMLISDEFEEIVDKYGIDHQYVHFEITESLNASDTKRMNYSVNRFREKGFSVELDDFGSGYSSLTTLSELPVDVVKLDMGLIQRMFEKKHSAVLSGALFTARELTLKVVAEGVETAEQLQELKWRGSHIKELSVQGFYFSKPLPKEEFKKYLLDADAVENDYSSYVIKNADSLPENEHTEEGGENASYTAEYKKKKYKALMEIPGTVMYEYNPYTDEMSVEIFEENGKSRKRSAGDYFNNARDKHWIHASYVDSYLDTIRMVYTYGRAKSVMARALMEDGDYRMCKYYFAPIKDDQDNVTRVVGRGEIVDYARDTDIFQNITTGTFRYSVEYKQEFDYISESLLDLLGFESEEAFRKFYSNSFIDFVYEEDRERVLAEIDDQIRGSNIDYCEYRVIKADGSILWVYDRGTLVIDEFGGKWFYVTIADLDDYKAKQLRKQREHDRLVSKFSSDEKQDKLTRLDTLDYALHLIDDYVQKKDTGIFFLFDIDNLTAINERRGHITGDQIIIDFADILRSTFREGDIVGRYGGDIFVAYMPEVGSRDIAKKKASLVLDRALQIKSDGVIPLSVSVAMVDDASIASSSKELITMAQDVLRKIKKNGKSGIGFYEES